MSKRYGLGTLFLVLMLFTSSCGNAATTTRSSSSSAPSSFTIAYQPGLSSLVVLKQQRTLEKQFPQTSFQWKVVNSGASVRDAMIANQAQLGSLGACRREAKAA